MKTFLSLSLLLALPAAGAAGDAPSVLPNPGLLGFVGGFLLGRWPASA